MYKSSSSFAYPVNADIGTPFYKLKAKEIIELSTIIISFKSLS